MAFILFIHTEINFSFQDFEGVSVEYVKLPGWKSSIAKCTKFEDLPENAKSYVKTIEDHLNIPSK